MTALPPLFNLEKPFGVPNRAPAHRRYKRAWVAGMRRDWLLALIGAAVFAAFLGPDALILGAWRGGM